MRVARQPRVPSARYMLDPHVRITPEHPDGRILTNAASDTLYALNAVGAWIWTRLEEGASAAEIASRLAIECQIPAGTVEHDVCEFLDRLEERRLIHAVRE